MAISTQRLALVFFCINLIIGVVSQIYFDPDASNFDIGTVTMHDQLMEQYENEMYDDSGILGGLRNKVFQTAESVGNVVKWGRIILNIALDGINPFSISYADFDTTLEKVGVFMLSMFRVLMWIVVAIEGYMFFINRKTS